MNKCRGFFIIAILLFSVIVIPKFIFSTESPEIKPSTKVYSGFNIDNLSHVKSFDWTNHITPITTETLIQVTEKSFEEDVIELEALSSYTGYSVAYLRGCTPEQRRAIEVGTTDASGYSRNTGNGYLGAYQFSENYNAGRWEEAFGTPYPGHEAFLNDPAAQDALADWYANSRYGGWENVPSSGGW